MVVLLGHAMPAPASANMAHVLDVAAMVALGQPVSLEDTSLQPPRALQTEAVRTAHPGCTLLPAM